MLGRERHAVHLIGDQHVVPQGHLQRKAVHVAVRRVEGHALGAGGKLRPLQQLVEPHALPERVAREKPAYGVADARERDVLLHGRHCQQLFVGELEGIAHVALEREPPRVGVDVGHDVTLGHHVEVLVGRDLRRDTLAALAHGGRREAREAAPDGPQREASDDQDASDDGPTAEKLTPPLVVSGQRRAAERIRP